MLKFRQIACIIVFAVFLILPGIDTLYPFAPRPELNEMRLPAKCPTWNWTRPAIRAFPSRFELYFNDAFGFRNWLAYAYSYAQYFWLNTSPHRMTQAGRNGWLYYGLPEEIRSFQRVDPYNPEELRRKEQYFAAIREWLASRGTAFVLMIPPNKSTVYPENIPASLRRAAGPGRLDQLVDRCRQRGIPVIDLREIYEMERQRAPVYYRLDTHWTQYGGFLACRELMRAIAPENANPGGLANLTWSTNATDQRTGDLALVMGLDKLLLEPVVTVNWTSSHPARCTLNEGATFSSVRRYETDHTNLPAAVMFRDSFSEHFIDALASNFRELIAAWQYAFDPKLVEQWNPDIVICEFVERSLYMQPDPFGNPTRMIARASNVQPAIDFHKRVGRNAEDAESLMGTVREATPPASPGWLMYGRYAKLDAGPYTVTFRVKARSAESQAIARIDVSANQGKRLLGERVLDAESVRAPGAWDDVRINFTIPDSGLEGVEYRVEYLGGGDIAVDYIHVARQ